MSFYFSLIHNNNVCFRSLGKIHIDVVAYYMCIHLYYYIKSIHYHPRMLHYHPGQSYSYSNTIIFSHYSTYPDIFLIKNHYMTWLYSASARTWNGQDISLMIKRAKKNSLICCAFVLNCIGLLLFFSAYNRKTHKLSKQFYDEVNDKSISININNIYTVKPVHVVTCIKM